MKYLMIYFVLAVSAFGQTNFTTGQVSPLFEDRFDLKIYQAGCRQLENMFVYPQGTANKRPGTKLMANYPIDEVAEREEYQLTYFSDNGYIWGLPMQDLSIDSFSALAVAAHATLHTVNFDGADEDNPIAVNDAISSGAKSGICTEIVYTTSATGYLVYTLDDGSDDFSNNNVITNGTETVTASENGGFAAKLPFTSHPFDDTWNVYITNSTNYNGSKYVLTGSEDTNYIIINEQYTAETFDGTEQVTRMFSMGSSPGSISQDSDGNIYVGINKDGDHNNSIVLKIETDGTLVHDYFASGDAWSSATTCHELKVSGDYLYVMSAKYVNYIYKFKLSDGSLVWKSDAIALCYEFDIDEDGNVYIGGKGSKPSTYSSYVLKLNASTGASSDVEGCPMYNVHTTVVDDDLGIIIVGGQSVYREDNEYEEGYNLMVCDLDGSDTRGVRFGGLTHLVVDVTTITIEEGNVWTHGSYIYVIIPSEPTLYQLDTDLNIIAQTSLDASYDGGYYDMWGNLILVNGTSVPTDPWLLWLNSADITEELASETKDNWGGAYFMYGWENAQCSGVGFTFPDPDPEYLYYEPQTYLSEVDEYAIKIIPFQYSTDDCYILEFGKYYLGFYRAGAQIEN